MASLVKSSFAAPGGARLAGLTAWSAAAKTLARWLATGERIDRLMEALPALPGAADRARCQYLVYGVVRHAGRLGAALDSLVRRRPRPNLRAVLLTVGFEFIEGGFEEGRVAKVAHHAVNQAKALTSPAEASLVNAVARRMAAVLGAQRPPPADASAEDLAAFYSHPPWLVRRWIEAHGPSAVRSLLEWNQRPAPVYARWRPASPAPEWLPPTGWPGFFDATRADWSRIDGLLSGGLVYLQDPLARLSVQLLAPRPGEAVLDLCAAPGGKALQIADALAAGGGKPGRLVAVDLPGDRLRRLRENLSRAPGIDAVAIGADIRSGLLAHLAKSGLPAEFPAVLLDAPCSNTGVIRRRVDVKWRLEEADIGRNARLELALLSAASRLVAEGGRLVYSTCSVEPEENEGVAKAFLEGPGRRFSLRARDLACPWIAGHDGGGAYLFVRESPGNP